MFPLNKSSRLSGRAISIGLGLAAVCVEVNAEPISQGEEDSRANAIVDAMTLEEQISLLRPVNALNLSAGPGADLLPERLRRPLPNGAIGSAAFVPGIPRLRWPALQESDGPVGISNIGGYARPGDQATALPAGTAVAATFDLDLAKKSGEILGKEAHAKGFNIVLAGGVNLARDPRNGRNFEYAGEDPLLAGMITGATVSGIQSQHVVSTVKHFALNSQESGRKVLNAVISEPAARESDLLAFEIAIREGQPGSVMCAYMRYNGDYACENDFLLNQVLKKDWGFKGWVMSDWGAVHSLNRAIDHGLDQESPQEPGHFYGLRRAVSEGRIDKGTVRTMALRIIRSMLAVGAFDDPATADREIDEIGHGRAALAIAEAGAVLLKNDGVLPLKPSVRKVLLVGGHADKWIAAGAGSSQVNPFGGLRRDFEPKVPNDTLRPAYIPSSPMDAMKAVKPEIEFSYDNGDDLDRVAALAASVDVVLVFANKIQTESMDSADLSLLPHQNALIAAAANSNRHTVVVLQTGNPVTMPWLSKVGAVLEAWYPGQRGGEAIANLITGRAAPSGRLPMTFPLSVSQLPRPKLDGYAPPTGEFDQPVPPFSVNYDIEGSDVGYKWFERTRQTPLFPFGHGLSYTTFSYKKLKVSNTDFSVRFRITNTGSRAGVDVPQLYIAPPGKTHRLVGWSKVELEPGESRIVTISADPRVLRSWFPAGWETRAGQYSVVVSPSASLKGLRATLLTR